ncbi:CAMP factor family pore-forming toxin [Streptococcus halichoeri]|uniref:CAMP factor family pore-forming toxin n=1 Tax=Streptococcus halichoeri TaxID=254785 RepID=UPI00135C1DF8|nr:CAMP factor family pore-forming toxin [Streptococcus halichoeri]
MTIKKHMLYLSGAMLAAGITLFSPAVLKAHADQATSPITIRQVNTQNQQLEQQLNQDSAQLNAIKDDVKGTDIEQPVTTALDTVEKLKTSLEVNPASIYDLSSIGVRVEALSDVIEAITFSTQHLANKVSQANIDMGFAITKLVIRIADPFASVDAIKAQVAEVKKVEQAVLTYPDLKPTDKATIYTKAKLDKAIWQTRIQRDQKVLNVKSFAVYNTLNKAITHAVGVQLNPNATVQEVDQEIANLNAALQAALK